MADNAEGSGEGQITFKVKTGGDKTHTITVPDATTVIELKNKLAGEEYEKVPAERQRLIYSGRVMKNDDALSVYNIKHNNTLHMVKSAASNPTPPSQQSSASTAANPAPSAVPQNMASGVANNPLAGLTGARYAGHINLPSRDMFGADGGMGAPPSEDQMTQMLSDPSVMQTMNAALDNPQFIDYMIQSNPQLRNMPNAREIIQSPFMRQMMTNPDMIRNVMRMQRGMAGGQGAGAFPAPGETDNNPEGGEGNNASGQGGEQPANPFGFPFGAPPGAAGGAGGSGAPDFSQMMAQLGGLNSFFGAQGAGGQTASAGAGAGAGAGETGASGTGTEGQGAAGGTSQNPPPANPFAALFGAPPPGAGGQGEGQAGQTPGQMPNPFANPEMMQQMMNMFGGGMGGGAGGSPAAPADNRPPEERYEDQLRQLNDMGFFDFDRNVAALRRSGGSVQGAVEYLLSQ